MRNIKVRCAFAGTAYHGFQRQNNANAVQNEIERVLSRLTCENIVINGCSRTDRGVHANEYFFSFGTASGIPCTNIVSGMNSLLPDDIRVYDAEDVPQDFHARYSCKGKEYIYIIDNSKVQSPFKVNRAFHYPYPADADRMDKELASLLGTHDFSSFCGALGKKEDSTRTIFDAGVYRSGSDLIFHITGDGFLYNMVRIICGTLIYVNEGKISSVKAVLDACDRNSAGITAPACGLYLNRVYYDDSFTVRTSKLLK